jgi:putative transposase
MPKTKDAPRRTRPAGIGKVLKRLHYPLDVIVLSVRWYVAYSLSLRNLEERMAERGIEVDHSSVHRWVIKLVPQAHGKEVRAELTDRVQLHER